MNSSTSKDNTLNSAILIAAWLIIIAAGVEAYVEASSQVVRIAYQAEQSPSTPGTKE
jgi:hypothetical protein